MSILLPFKISVGNTMWVHLCSRGFQACFSHSPSQIVYCCWLAFGLVFCYVLIVETKGLSLEDTATLFGSEDACSRPSDDEKGTKGSISKNWGVSRCSNFVFNNQTDCQILTAVTLSLSLSNCFFSIVAVKCPTCLSLVLCFTQTCYPRWPDAQTTYNST